jgi:CDP-glucose 4,6-dehydratase
MFDQAYKGKRVWISGHTGFKGAWLAEWLLSLGAHVHGYALPPDSAQPLFGGLSLGPRLESEFADIRDAAAVRRSLADYQPDFVFHLAAQPLVRLSYEIPTETMATNVMGTVHVLDALRALRQPCAAVMVTSDKCYENLETGRPHEEADPMGGRDPYSASKGMAELAVASYQRSFFDTHHPVRVASVRAGNVIGGGDLAADRIVPDILRARAAGRALAIRNPSATRPWQHVLEPLSGYLWIGACLASPSRACVPAEVVSGFNFGPRTEAVRTVGELVAAFGRAWPDLRIETGPAGPHEAARLSLSIAKAERVLGWRPVWDFQHTVERTACWYAQLSSLEACKADITAYVAAARSQNLAWAS